MEYRCTKKQISSATDRDAWSVWSGGRVPAESPASATNEGDSMVALIVLLLLLLLLGGFGFAAHVLWWILIAAVVIWAIGFFVGGAADAGAGGRRGWYRW
jgi:hypothetical protein